LFIEQQPPAVLAPPSHGVSNFTAFPSFGHQQMNGCQVEIRKLFFVTFFVVT
jgi:hypothetical protein